MPAKILRVLQQYNNGWMWVSLSAAAILLLPIFAILLELFGKPSENWRHITQYMIGDYVLQSVWLVVLTGMVTLIIGTTLAWLIAAYDFPLRRMLRWALVLPLAVPPYIAAYTYANMFSYTGTIQVTLRKLGITADQGWFDIMSLPGAVFIFSFFLYPYVYMITRAYLERQSGSYIENARLFGRKPAAVFFHIALPLSRPAIAGGLTLVAFEVLSDYGVVNYYGIQTFTTAIFRTWFGMYDIDSATRLAAWFLVVIIGIILLERIMRGRRAFSATTSRGHALTRLKLRGWAGWAAALYCGVIVSIGCIIPVVQLIVWARWTFSDVLANADFVRLTFNSVSVAAMATVLIVILSLIVANTARMLNNAVGSGLARLITTGYSVPGAIIAIGILSLFIQLDHWLAPMYRQLGWGNSPLVLSMSLAMLVTAYVIRFMATGYSAVEAGMEKVGRSYWEASRQLGAGLTRTFVRIDLPLLKGSLLTGIILTFVEVVKELPLALLLRPFNFDTLATKAYQYASDERIYAAALPSLLVIGVSLLSIIMLHYAGKDAVQ